MSQAPLGLGVPTVEHPRVLPFKNSSPCSMDGEGQPWPLKGGKPGDAPLGSLIPDRLPGSAASMARTRDRSAGTGTGMGSRSAGA